MVIVHIVLFSLLNLTYRFVSADFYVIAGPLILLISSFTGTVFNRSSFIVPALIITLLIWLLKMRFSLNFSSDNLMILGGSFISSSCGVFIGNWFNSRSSKSNSKNTLVKRIEPFKLFKLWGIPIYIHWSLTILLVFLFVVSFQSVFLLILVIASSILLLIHELGHALMARKYGRHVDYIVVSIFNGRCVYKAAETEFENAMIAWGGVFAQLAVAIPLVAFHIYVGSNTGPYLQAILLAFGYFNVLIIIINLLPFKGFDGAICWSAIPLSINHSKRVSKKRKSYLKSVK